MKSIFKKILVALLTLEARAALALARPFIIAITGTVGKTSAKDAIAAALSPFAEVQKSGKSYNSDIGVPLAILGEQNQWKSMRGWCAVLARGCVNIMQHRVLHKKRFLVLEVGTDRPGDIHMIVRWLRPHAVVVTKLSRAPVHMENFTSIGDLIAEKGALVSAVRVGGTLVLNGDDAQCLAYRALASHGTHIISFGVGREVYIENYDTQYDSVHLPVGFSCAASVFGKHVTLAIFGVIGKSHALAMLPAFALVHILGFDIARAARALTEHTPALGRMRLIDGINNSLIIDDSYNSSPVAVEEALATLRELNAPGRKIAVLGDMLELGEVSEVEHIKMGIYVAQSAELLFFVGEQARAAAASARASGFPPERIREFADARVAGEALAQEIHSGDIILIKGSQGLRMERVVERVMREPIHAPSLLVRQEPEWKRKK